MQNNKTHNDEHVQYTKKYSQNHSTQAVREAATICPCHLWPWPLIFDLESGVRVTCDVAYLCAILVFLGLSVLDLGPIFATDVVRQTSESERRQTA